MLVPVAGFLASDSASANVGDADFANSGAVLGFGYLVKFVDFVG